MDCTNLNNAAEILEAFRVCQNPGEQIELFESLATRSDPPIEAFVELLRNIKLEVVLALTIQAFGQITNADVKARLKQSDDLLAMLSQQAQSGASDLIRWSAATAIETLGFDFIAVSQHLTEEPRGIAEKIVQSKIKRFVDRDLLESEGYQEFLNFWIYGDRYKLREVTLDYDVWKLQTEWSSKKDKGWQNSEDRQEIERLNKFSVCWEVMKKLDLKGLKEANSCLDRAESRGQNALATDENEVFEGIAQLIAKKKKKKSRFNQKDAFDVQIHCLQSQHPKTRKNAALLLSSLDIDFVENSQEQPISSIAISTFSKLLNSLDYPYSQLKELADNLEKLVEGLSRTKVVQHCKDWLKNVLARVEKIENDIKERNDKCQKLYNEQQNILSQIQSIDIGLYQKNLKALDLDIILPVVANDDAISTLNEYEDSLKSNILTLNFALAKLNTELNELEVMKKNISGKRQKIINNIEKIRFINQELYNQIFAELKDIEEFNYREDFINYFNEYEIYLSEQQSKLIAKVNKFYKSDDKSRIKEFDKSRIKELRKDLADLGLKARKLKDNIKEFIIIENDYKRKIPSMNNRTSKNIFEIIKSIFMMPITFYFQRKYQKKLSSIEKNKNTLETEKLMLEKKMAQIGQEINKFQRVQKEKDSVINLLSFQL